MPKDFIPSREAELITWSTNFEAKISLSPVTYGLTAAQATEYGNLHAAFFDAYQVANAPATRSPANIVAKNTAKEALIANARQLAGIVQKFPATTDAQRAELGLTVPAAEPTPINPPAIAPSLDVVSVVGRTVKLRLHDVENPARRGKPDGVAGASVFSHVGAAPPSEDSAWKFEGSTSRTTFDVEFDAGVASGATVWLAAFWFNPRSQSGPACTPISTTLQGGAEMAA